MTFAEACAKIRKEEIEKEVKFEIENAEHNNMKAFHSCTGRSIAFAIAADKRECNFRAYTFVLNALSKKEKHKLSAQEVSKLEEEKTDLIADMSDYPEDIMLAENGITIYSWWRS